MKEYLKVCLFFAGDEELTMDAIQGDSSDLFAEPDTDSPFEEKEVNKEQPADEVDPETIFAEDKTQGTVGDKIDDEKDKVELPESDKDKGSSPKLTHSSAYLKALKDDGVLPDLTDEFIAGADTPEKFAEAIEMQVSARYDAGQKKIKEALDNNVQVADIKKFENALNYLDSINEDTLSEESDDSANLRKQIIYQDYINKNFKPERANKEVNKSFNAGTDIEDAQSALESNKEFFTEQYDDAIAVGKEKTKQEKIATDLKISNFRKQILDTESPFGITVDKTTRQKMLDNIVKPVYKEKDGKLLTELQKYSKENPNDSEYYFSLFYTMTDGFKNIDKLVGQKVKQGTKSALRELDKKLKNTPLNNDGSIDFNYGLDSQSASKNYKF